MSGLFGFPPVQTVLDQRKALQEELTQKSIQEFAAEVQRTLATWKGPSAKQSVRIPRLLLLQHDILVEIEQELVSKGYKTSVHKGEWDTEATLVISLPDADAAPAAEGTKSAE